VKRIEGLDLVVDLGKTEARLPKKEQSRLESFSVGDRVRCIIKTVERTGKNAGVNVSRAAPELVMRLFEQEVPEIYDGTVVIRACAREAGERTKIAVLSKDRDVDCVGACVGMKGMRVQSIIRELRGEKIDIIEYNEDAQKFVEKALSPARISRVAIVDPEGKHMEVIVEDAQLSLAIGKKGQNVRLAAKLIGWRVDIKTEEEKRQEVEAAMVQLGSGTPLSTLIDHGLSEEVYEVLVAGGIGTVEKVASMTPEELELIAGVTSDSVAQLGMAVNSFYGHIPAEAPVEALAGDLAGDLAGEPVEVQVEEPAEEPAPEPVQDTAEVDESAGETSPESVSTEVESVQEAVVEAPAGEASVSAGLESDTIENSGLPRAGSSEN
jgi:N utilization substance protein A